MSIFRKRVFANLIDSFIYGTIYALVQISVPGFTNLVINSKIFVVIIFIPFFFRDILFRNASIGKKLLGISIYDRNWKPPKIRTLVIRSFCTMTIVAGIVYKSRVIDGSILDAIDWEREKLGTMVIDKKVYKKLSEEARAKKGDFSQNMTELYCSYLRDLYLV